MAKLKTCVFVFFFLFSKVLVCEIIEIYAIEEILPYIDQDTLVVFDIDNTLITTKQMAGGDMWFQHSVDFYQSQNLSYSESVAKTLPQYMKLQNATDVDTIETITPALIHKLQRNGNFVIGLTARSTELAYKTKEQLASVDIHLNKNSPKCDKLNLSSYFSLNYIEGILFASHNHKGEILFKLIHELDFPINKVVFVDDKRKYVEQLEKVCEQYRIPFTGFRYGAFDTKVKSFESKVADIQMKYFERILSNEAADLILQKKKGQF